MTNNQAGRINKYKSLLREILKWLAGHQAYRNYRHYNHRLNTSIKTYYNLKKQRETLDKLENQLVEAGLSRQKLHRMNCLIRKCSNRKELSKVDIISNFVLKEFFELVTIDLRRLEYKQKFQVQADYSKEYVNFIQKKRAAAVKGLPIEAQTRYFMTCLKRLYLTLCPDGVKMYDFINQTLDNVERSEKYLPMLVKRARQIDPWYAY